MTPLKTKLVNAIGIKSGLGLDELEIDFRNEIPADAVTVALRGDNGSGKSTLMDLGMTPWLNPPQIPGRIYDEFDGNGLRELEWEHNGINYQSVIQHKRGAQDSTAAYLYVFDAGAWLPYVLPNGIECDGKTRTYTAALQQILGPQSVYYMSAFRAQNAPKLANYDDPNQLMRDLLALGSIRKLADDSNEVRKVALTERNFIAAEVKALSEKEAALIEHESTLETLQDKTPFLRADQEQAVSNYARAKASFEQAVAENLDLALIRNERAKVKAKIHASQDRLQKSKDEHRDSLAKLEAQRVRTQRKNADDCAVVRSGIQHENACIDRNKGILDREEEIKKAQEELPKLIEAEQEAEQELVDLEKQHKTRVEAAIQLTRIAATINKAADDYSTTSNRKKEYDTRAGFVDEVPCHGESPYDTCPALKEANQAASLAEECKTAMEKSDQALAEAKKKQKEVSGLFALTDGIEGKIDEQKDALTMLRVSIIGSQQAASLAQSLEQAREAITESESRIKAHESHLVDIDNALVMDLAQMTADIVDLGHQIAAREEESAVEQDLLQDELKALPEVSDNDAQAHAERVRNQANDAVHKCTVALEENTAKIATLKATVDNLHIDIAKGAEITKTEARLNTEIEKWSLLTDALKGVIDLSIEDAGPAVAALANDLLRAAYGPRFTVRIVSQREQQNGKLVECFDISVIDSETGIESSIIHKSGGESVWLDKALTDAFGLYHQDASGTRFGTLFADESEDGLTAERKQQFYQMDRAMLSKGGYTRKYFVSHHPDAWDMADHVIDMEAYHAH